MATTTLPPLADPARLARKLKRPDDDPLIVDAVQRASDRFRDAVRHLVTEVVEDQLRVDGTGRRVLRLPVVNVTEVSEVTIDDDPVEVRWSTDGLLERRDGALWPRLLGAVRVTLTHGFPEDEIPDGIADVVLDEAEAIYNTRRGIASYQVGGISISQGSQEALGVSERWSQAVNRWGIRRGDRA